jgi:D-lactate dehydrogenase
MKIAFFNTKPYDRQYFNHANQAHGHTLVYFESHLREDTVRLVTDEEVVCCFINDSLNADILAALKAKGVRLIALRSAGFNHVDMNAARELELPVVRVPAYSPYAVAEHTAGLLLALNRRLHRAYNRVREGDFSINGLMGFDLHGKTVGIIGCGKIGLAFLRIMQGFGCKLLVHDLELVPEAEALGASFLPLNELLPQADIVSLHCPLTPDTRHLINAATLAQMKPGVTLLNTSRGKLLDTRAVIHALKSGHIGLLGLDVYEEEEAMFFEDLSDSVIHDDVFARLMTFHNVLITSHQAFFTHEAVSAIAATTLGNVSAFAKDGSLANRVP